MLNWFNDNAGAVQGISAIVSVFVTIILVVITVFYSIKTADIAQETRGMAVATEQLAAAEQQQQRAPVRPVVIFTDLTMKGKGFNEFMVHVKNAGPGRLFTAW